MTITYNMQISFGAVVVTEPNKTMDDCLDIISAMKKDEHTPFTVKINQTKDGKVL